MGIFSVKPILFPTSRNIDDLNEAKYPDHGLIAPSSILLDASGIISSGSYSVLMPRPLHPLQAPKGELNEKLRGSISPRLTSHLGMHFVGSKASHHFRLQSEQS